MAVLAGFDAAWFSRDSFDSLLGVNETTTLTNLRGASIEGSEIADIIIGHGTYDFIETGGGNDVITLNAGNDRLWGQDGNDSLASAIGNDTMTGGAGADEFQFYAIPGAAGTGLVTDFDVLEDLISFVVGPGATAAEQMATFLDGASQSGVDVVWTSPDGAYTATFQSVDLTAVSLTNFTDVGSFYAGA